MSIESKELVIPSSEGKDIVYTPELVNVIKNTVAKEATDEELFMFLSIAQKYGLDPFAKEIWFIKYKNKKTGEFEARIETARDGYLAIAKRDPDYMGVQSFAVHENDEFSMEIEDAEVKNVVHKFTHKDRGHIVGGWAVAKHKTKENVYEFLPFKEARQNQPIWSSHPTLMMKKVVESVVLKRMAGITGLVTSEEMGTDVIRYTEKTDNKPLSSEKNDKKKPKSISESYEGESTGELPNGASDLRHPKGIDPDKVQDAEITEKKPDWKALAKKSPALKKVCDKLNEGGFDIDEHLIYVEAGSMNQRKELSDKELDEIEVLLGRKA